jgi:hypothetical protein
MFQRDVVKDIDPIFGCGLGCASVLMLALLLLAVGLSWYEGRDERYPSLSAVLDRGRDLTAYLPSSSTDIRVFYWIDGPRVWAAFRYEPAADFQPNERCAAIDPRTARQSSGSPWWGWPRALSDPHHRRRAEYRWFRCVLEAPDPTEKCTWEGLLVLRPERKQGYWWTAYAE